MVISLLALSPTVYMLEVYDRVINSRDLLTLGMLTFLALSAYVVMDVLEIVRTRLFWGAGVRFDLAIKERIGQAMMDAMLRRRGVSPMMVMADLRSVREFFVNPSIAAAFEVPMSLLACVLIFLINPMLGWAALIGGTLQAFVAWETQRRSSGPLQEAQQHSQEAQMYAEAALRNAQAMHAMGMLEQIRQRWRFRQSAFLARQAQASEAASALGALSRLLQQLMGSVLLGMSAWLVIGGELAGGGSLMIISSVLGGRMLSPLVQMIAQWSSILTTLGAWRRLQKLLQEVPPREPTMQLPAPRGQLSVEQVLTALDKAEVPAGRIYTVADIAADPHYQERGMLQSLVMDDGSTMTVPAIVPKLSVTPGQHRRNAPQLGQDTDQVLAEMGLSPDQIQSLKARGIVGGQA